MALAPSHLPAPVRRPGLALRARLAPARRQRFERLDCRDALSHPSELALRSLGNMPGLYRNR